MTSKITQGVTISVETFYQPEYSNPQEGECMFAYRITIENSNSYPVQLLSRHWYIIDSIGTTREVEGDGVVGIQPVIKSNELYQYISGCNLKSEIGKMHGTYAMQNLHNKMLFNVQIPAFNMVAPFKLN